MSASTDALVAAKEALNSGLAQHADAALALIDAALAEDGDDISADVSELLGPQKVDLTIVADEDEDVEAEAEAEAGADEMQAGAEAEASAPFAFPAVPVETEAPQAAEAAASDEGFNAS